MKPLLIILSIFLATAAGAQRYSPATEKEKLPYETGLFASADGTVFDLTNELNNSAIGHLNILDWLQGRVAGLQVYSLRNGNRIAVIRNSIASVYVDEFRTDYGFLNMIPVSDIAYIKIIKQPFVFGGPGGVIAIYTKDGSEEEDEP